MRKRLDDGTAREPVFTSYAVMRQPGNNAAAVVTALRAGLSTRS